MKSSVGIVELVGSANAIYSVDQMLKAANVSYLSKETIFGSGRVTVFMQGDLSSVTVAVEKIKACDALDVFATYIIASPHPETQKFLKKSMMKHMGGAK